MYLFIDPATSHHCSYMMLLKKELYFLLLIHPGVLMALQNGDIDSKPNPRKTNIYKNIAEFEEQNKANTGKHVLLFFPWNTKSHQI